MSANAVYQYGNEENNYIIFEKNEKRYILEIYNTKTGDRVFVNYPGFSGPYGKTYPTITKDVRKAYLYHSREYHEDDDVNIDMTSWMLRDKNYKDINKYSKFNVLEVGYMTLLKVPQ